MIKDARKTQVVFTNKARCRDCNRCVRVCPVKAIRITDGQAFVEKDRCIACGTCIRECPQGAKTFRNDTERALNLLKTNPVVAASVAPSFPGVFESREIELLPSVLRKLGFSFISETVVGARYVADATEQYIRDSGSGMHICSSCPACVRYVELYRPSYIGAIVPVVSPMIAHARHLKMKLGEHIPVIFIGPCVTKKAEADRSEYAGLIDCVLTFSELREMIAAEGIDFSECGEGGFDETAPDTLRYFPLEGGALKASSINTDILNTSAEFVTGFDDFTGVLESGIAEDRQCIVEPLFCSHGCINGPAVSAVKNVYQRRLDVASYIRNHSGNGPVMKELPVDVAVSYKSQPVYDAEDITEDDIRAIFEKTGHERDEDRLNCGACGYDTCRERAVAVFMGLAEPEMCIPYMRRRAEQRSDRIMETSPNGIVILDSHLRIIAMNPAFKRFFTCSEAVSGRHISYLMDPEPFENLAVGDKDLLEIVVSHDRYRLLCHEILYVLPGENQYVGILVNITQNSENYEKLRRFREQTVLQAQELLEHQNDMAQTIAKFLGESSARGEALVENLMTVAAETAEKKQPLNIR